MNAAYVHWSIPKIQKGIQYIRLPFVQWNAIGHQENVCKVEIVRMKSKFNSIKAGKMLWDNEVVAFPKNQLHAKLCAEIFMIMFAYVRRFSQKYNLSETNT